MRQVAVTFEVLRKKRGGKSKAAETVSNTVYALSECW